MALSSQQPRLHEPIDHRAQLRVGEAQRTPAPMPARTRRLRGAEIRDQAVNPQVGAQRLASMKSLERFEQAPLGEPLIGGVYRSVAHGRRCGQPTVGVGRAPSTAIRIAWASSSES